MRTFRYPMIRCSDLLKDHKNGGKEHRVLHGITFVVQPGEFLSIMGPSGSGKTTLLNIVGALDHPTSGTVELDGFDITSIPESTMHTIRQSLVSHVFQQFRLVPTLTVYQNVMIPLVPRRLQRSKKKRMALESLDLVGLLSLKDRYPNQLSGGQQQKVAIARALVNRPSLLLADEPTGNLDSKSGQEIMNLLLRLNRSGLTIVMVTHNPRLAKRTGRTIYLRDGTIWKDIDPWDR